MLWERKGVSTAFDKERRKPGAPALREAEKSAANGVWMVSSATGSGPSGSMLGASLAVRGELSLDEDLLIEGTFEGSLQLKDHNLTVGPQATIRSDIAAGRVAVLGTVKGNITAREKIEIRKTGHVAGDLMAPGVVIEAGAYYKGRIEIQRHEEATPPLQAQTATA
jgi:cytoskeletal protein CcmA (bactofilin family)